MQGMMAVLQALMQRSQQFPFPKFEPNPPGCPSSSSEVLRLKYRTRRYQEPSSIRLTRTTFFRCTDFLTYTRFSVRRPSKERLGTPKSLVKAWYGFLSMEARTLKLITVQLFIRTSCPLRCLIRAITSYSFQLFAHSLHASS